MAEQRFERDLRVMLAADLDPVHGPHPRWADAPAARRLAAPATTPPRWRSVAVLAAALVGVLVLALALAVMPREAPVASAPPASVEPWPSTLGPSTPPTGGEVALGSVAVASAFGEPAILIRASPAATRGGDGVGLTIEARLVGRLDRAFGIDRFIVVRGGRAEAPGLGVSGADPLAIPVDAPIGTSVSTTVVIPAGPDENVDLGYAGSGTSITFSYPIHRAPPVSSVVQPGRCPTLEDYAAASLQPSAAPAAPSFEPVAPSATPSTGLLALGATGILPAPDGSPGGLVRVSNVRFCDRLPDYRPDWTGVPDQLLLADVEIVGLKAGAITQGFLPGSSTVVVNAGPHVVSPVHMFGMPGANQTTTLATGPGFAYRGTIAWEINDDGRRVTVDVLGAERGADEAYVTQFSYLAREGTTSTAAPMTPAPTSDPAASPTSGTARLGERIVLAAEGGTMPVVVAGVDQVARYPGVVPAPPAEAFLEVRLTFGSGSGTFALDPAEWVVVGPAGVAPRLVYPDANQIPPGWPSFIGTQVVREIGPAWPEVPTFVVAGVPVAGRVTLEYRPAGGPALVTWVLRDR